MKDSTPRVKNSRTMLAGISQTMRASLVRKPLSSRCFMMAGKTGSVAAVQTMQSTATENAFQ